MRTRRIGWTRKAALLVVLIPIVTGAASRPSPRPVRIRPLTAEAAVDTRLGQAIDAVASKAIGERISAGYTVGVMREGRVLFVKGYGFANLEDGVAARSDTIYRVGSITKQFTAAAVLKLAEDGRLSLDDPLSKYVPSFPRASEVTLRQLLTHTAGIHSYTALPDYLTTLGRRDVTTSDMVTTIAGLQPAYDFEPGRGWSYSNSGFYLLGAVIEKASGQSYAEYLRTALFVPLGLADTRVDDLLPIVPHRAAGYEKVDGTPPFFRNADYATTGPPGAAGAIRSSARDLLVWHAALLGGRVLKPASLAAMLAPGRLSDGRLASAVRVSASGEAAKTEYGFGITTGLFEGRRVVAHGGSINGFNAALATFPDQRVTVVVLANTGGGTVRVATDIERTVLGVLAAR